MPRGRKPKSVIEVEPPLSAKKEVKAPKSPWNHSEEKSGCEFSQAVIEKNRQMGEKTVIASIPVNGGFANKRDYTLTATHLKTALNSLSEECLYSEAGSQDTFALYYQQDETDNEVISRLRQKKVELEKLTEELSECCP